MIKYERKKFFDSIRDKPFRGLRASAVKNIEVILAEAERRQLDTRYVAYMLATVLGECGANMAPIPEVGKGRGHPYGRPVNGKVYYGRGYVQLTWDYNYKKLGMLIGIDLLGNPELALHPDIATKILFEGMLRGSFTNKKLSDYFNTSKTDWVNARRIINGLDRANELAGYAKDFYTALMLSKQTQSSPVAPTVVKTTGWLGVLAASWTAMITLGQAHPWAVAFGVAGLVVAGLFIQAIHNKHKAENNING